MIQAPLDSGLSGPQPYSQVWPDGKLTTPAPAAPAAPQKKDDMTGLY